MSATQLSATSADPAATKRNDVADTTDTADAVGEAAKATPKSSATRSSASSSVLPEPASVSDPEHSETTADRVASSSVSRDEISISSEKGGSADRLEKKDDHSSPGDRRSTETLECPPGFVGRVIGKGGETIKGLQAQSGAHITVDQNFPEGAPRVIGISGPPGCVAIAKRLVEELLRGGGARLGGGVGPGQAQQSVRCPKEMVGRVIGRGGETVKGLQAATGARIQIDQSASPCVVTITGNPRCVDAAARAVADVVRGGSTAAYGAANQRREAMAAAATYRRRSLARGDARFAYGDARFGASIPLDARFAPRDSFETHAMARFHSHSMAQLEHQFASMGYHGVSHPMRGNITASAASGGVPMEGHPRASAALYGFAGNRAPVTYGYGPGPGNEAEYAYGEYGVDPAGAMYAMQMQAQMQAHMMGMGVGVGAGMGEGPHDHGAEGRGGVGLPREGQGPGESPMGAGAWMPREQMAQFQQFQQEMMNAQAQHAGAFGPGGARGHERAGDRGAAPGTAYAEETRTGKQSGGVSGGEPPKAPPAGAEPATLNPKPSPPAGPRPPDGDAAWTPPPPP